MSRLRRGDLYMPYRGIRNRLPETADATIRERCQRYAPRLRPGQFFSHETALGLWGVPLPEWPYRGGIHVSAHRPAREPRIGGVVGHRLQHREALVGWPEGLPLEHPVRAWRQVGTLWRLDDLVVAGDHLVSGDAPLGTVADLREEIRTMGDVAGHTLQRALSEVRAGVRSPRETRLRLLLTRAGLPEPEINGDLHDERGRFVAELDLVYRRYRVGVEYDGRVHAEDANQFRKDADRWDAIRRAGWDHVRILNHHMRGDGREAVRRAGEALLAAGWQPGRS